MARRRPAPAPELTLLMVVNVAPERVAVTVEALAGTGPEVVLLADDRVRSEWIEGYRRLADAVHVVRHPGTSDALLGWALEQCHGRWVLQVDADEVPSRGLAGEVLEVMAQGRVSHAWVPVRWLWPDPAQMLDQWPWRPAYVPRLFRRDAGVVRVPARTHHVVEIDGRRRFLEHPLYHADLVLTDTAGRLAKAERYSGGRGGPMIEGRPWNEAFYLPEVREELLVAPLPPHDARLVRRFLADGGRLPRRPPAPVSHPAPEATLTRFEGRALGPEAYEVEIEILEPRLVLFPGEWRMWDLRVTNRSTAHWPGGMDADPRIRLAYRWVADDGTVQEGMRTPLPHALDPGESAIVPLEVLGPQERGERTIYIDLVHEHVRWFDQGVNARVPIGYAGKAGDSRRGLPQTLVRSEPPGAGRRGLLSRG